MENLLEYLVPLIFAAIWFFSNFMSKKSEDDAPGTPARRRSEEDDSEAIERQRRIQEEIRRKIMERRRQAEGGEPESAPAPPQPVLRREPVEVRKEVRDRAPAPQPKPAEGFSWGSSGNSYEQKMQAQLAQIEETKRKAELLKQQSAAASSKATHGANSSRKRSRTSFRGPARAMLRDPAAARAAFIYSEILGAPISQKKASSVPGLS